MKLVTLLLFAPATNARSFSALRRVKKYLRTTMSQARLNHLKGYAVLRKYASMAVNRLIISRYVAIITAREKGQCQRLGAVPEL